MNSLKQVAKALVAFGIVYVAPYVGVAFGDGVTIEALKEAATANLIEAIITGGLVWFVPNKP